MASFIIINKEATEALLKLAKAYGKEHNQLTSTMAASLMLAGITLLNTGMNDEQVRALFDQMMDMTKEQRAERNARPTVRS